MILELTGVAHGGFAVGRHDGKVYFVSGGIPGETVRVEVTREEKRFSYARVVEVQQASPDRVPHIWPAVMELGLGGADLGHVSIAGQRRWKADVITDCLRRIAKGSVLDEVTNAVGEVSVQGFSDGTRGTRTRVSFVTDDECRFAMRKASSHELVAVTEMPLALQELDRLDLFSGQWSAQLDPGASVKAVLPSDSAPVLVTPRGVWSAPGEPAPESVRERVLADAGEYCYRVHAGGFWQAHVDAPAVLLDAVLAGTRLEGTERVLELYSGAGLLSKVLAEHASHVTAIEGDRTANNDARRNAPSVTQRKASVTPRVINGRWDAVVLDPPRDGAGLPVARALAASGARRIVYVACDPAAMARDLAELSPAYEIADFQALDLFEHTHHVECVATLTRRASGR
ncbi:tRNA/tmRNA/rRNA uracil-C5-methylase, TrmA/RlmC/RlmD family [Ruaniaceae bacterium KH17]|nr:tRNA/tmRNA/rRNA uracil-C5-methylase, TrmA/RlmC/RlmD family [Ruaniaceae bacterium KH17]